MCCRVRSVLAPGSGCQGRGHRGQACPRGGAAAGPLEGFLEGSGQAQRRQGGLLCKPSFSSQFPGAPAPSPRRRLERGHAQAALPLLLGLRTEGAGTDGKRRAYRAELCPVRRPREEQPETPHLLEEPGQRGRGRRAGGIPSEQAAAPTAQALPSP